MWRIAVVHVEEQEHPRLLLHPPSQRKHSCTNYRGVTEAALNRAVMVELHKVIKDPKKLWRLHLERAERWKQETVLTVDVRANLETEEKRLEAVIGRLLDHLEAGEDVGLRLKQHRAELDALRVRLAEPEPIVESAGMVSGNWIPRRAPEAPHVNNR